MKLPPFLQRLLGGWSGQQLAHPITRKLLDPVPQQPHVEVQFDVGLKKRNPAYTMTKGQRKARAWRRLYAGGSS